MCWTKETWIYFLYFLLFKVLKETILIMTIHFSTICPLAITDLCPGFLLHQLQLDKPFGQCCLHDCLSSNFFKKSFSFSQATCPYAALLIFLALNASLRIIQNPHTQNDDNKLGETFVFIFPLYSFLVFVSLYLRLDSKTDSVMSNNTYFNKFKIFLFYLIFWRC